MGLKRGEGIADLRTLADAAERVEFNNEVAREQIALRADMLLRALIPDHEPFTSKLANISWHSSFYPLGESSLRRLWSEGSGTTAALLRTAAEQIERFSVDTDYRPADPLHHLNLLCDRFHSVVRRLRSRYSNRQTLVIEDEHDVQDLFGALLTLYFRDVRPEEYAPSFAGKNTRVDFLLKQEQVLFEIKMARPGLMDKEIGSQLIDDITRYRSHPDCKFLFCFVYDPNGLVRNPAGLERDLSKQQDDLGVIVVVRPC